MYARLVIAYAKPRMIDEIIKIDRDFVFPAEKKQKGFKSSYIFTNRDTNKGMAISLWETEADAIAWETSGTFRELSMKLMPYFFGVPILEGYEVSLQE